MPGFSQTSLGIILCSLTIGCGGDGPTGPSATSGYNGQWSGTTSQGRPITFVVSGDHVTAATVGYSFSGCSGTRTSSNLSLEIGDVPPPPPGTPVPPTAANGPHFFGTLGPLTEDDNVFVTGSFPSNTTANGVVVIDYPGCRNGVAIWDARKR